MLQYAKAGQGTLASAALTSDGRQGGDCSPCPKVLARKSPDVAALCVASRVLSAVSDGGVRRQLQRSSRTTFIRFAPSERGKAGNGILFQGNLAGRRSVALAFKFSGVARDY